MRERSKKEKGLPPRAPPSSSFLEGHIEPYRIRKKKAWERGQARIPTLLQALRKRPSKEEKK